MSSVLPQVVVWVSPSVRSPIGRRQNKKHQICEEREWQSLPGRSIVSLITKLNIEKTSIQSMFPCPSCMFPPAAALVTQDDDEPTVTRGLSDRDIDIEAVVASSSAGKPATSQRAAFGNRLCLFRYGISCSARYRSVMTDSCVVVTITIRFCYIGGMTGLRHRLRMMMFPPAPLQ